jgi:hypothetical protein
VCGKLANIGLFHIFSTLVTNKGTNTPKGFVPLPAEGMKIWSKISIFAARPSFGSKPLLHQAPYQNTL